MKKILIFLLLLFTSFVSAKPASEWYKKTDIYKASFSTARENAKCFGSGQVYDFLGYPLFLVYDVATSFGRTGVDDSIAWVRGNAVDFDGITGSGHTVVFEAGLWKIGGACRLFGLGTSGKPTTVGTTIIFEEGLKLEQIPGEWDDGTTKTWTSISEFKANYPSATGSTYATTRDAKAIWHNNTENIIYIAYGAEFQGSYPIDNPGNDPATTNTPNNSHEFQHFGQWDLVTGVEWYGGYIHNFGGDALNFTDIIGPVIVSWVEVAWNKRLGVGHIEGAGLMEISHSLMRSNGKADVSPVWGTNTRHGVTQETNLATQYGVGKYRNLALIDNADAGFGWHMNKGSNLAPGLFNFTMFGVHTEKNSTQVDNTRTAGIYITGTDAFNDNEGGNTQWGDAPLGGSISINSLASWEENSAFMGIQLYKGCPTLTMDNTASYKALTPALTNGNNGKGIIEYWIIEGALAGTDLADVDLGNMLIVDETGDEMINFNTMNTGFGDIESTFTGDLYLFGSNAESVLILEDPVNSNAHTISKTRWDLGASPATEINVTALNDQAVESNGEWIRIQFTRSSANTDFPMPVKYTVVESGENAEARNDYRMFRGSHVIPAGQTSVIDSTFARDNGVTESGIRSLTVTLEPKADLYTVGTNNSTVVYLMNDPGAERGAGGTPSSTTTGKGLFKLITN